MADLVLLPVREQLISTLLQAKLQLLVLVTEAAADYLKAYSVSLDSSTEGSVGQQLCSKVDMPNNLDMSNNLDLGVSNQPVSNKEESFSQDSEDFLVSVIQTDKMSIYL
jgi:hypothetical protein